MNWLRDKMRSWLKIERASGESVSIIEPLSFEGATLLNKIWYRGEPSELCQFYSQTNDMIGNTSFWAASSSGGVNFRKIHSGLPALIVDTLSNIVCSDLIGVETGGVEDDAVWSRIAAENQFGRLFKNAVRNALVYGDGAFRVSYDADASELPIIEFFNAERTRYEYDRGRLAAVIIVTEYEKERRRFVLEERHSRNGVNYRLTDEKGLDAPLDSLEETSGLADIENPERFMMAIPLMFDESPRFEGRGKSVFDGKLGAFDSLDETISQWVDALRDGRAIKYIPANMLPRHPDTGAILRPNSFDSRYVQTDADMSEDGLGKISVSQPEIRTDALAATYVNFLDICLQGVIAPSTLGIDVKKLDNAEAQREKEKATLYTRNKIIGALQEILPIVAETALRTNDMINGRESARRVVKAEFGEYANPSFEAQTETIGKARAYGIMSIETALTELYGDTWSDEKKEEEARRIRGDGEYDQGASKPVVSRIR
jgi:hypothetical protein